MKNYLEAALIASIAVFAPVKAAIITVFVLTLADMIIGVIAAKKRGESITSTGFKRTVGKIVLYEFALCMAFLCEQFLTGNLIPICKLVSGMIGLVEIKSILENADSINGSSLFKAVLDKIAQSNPDQSK